MKMLELRKTLKADFIKNNIEPTDVDFIIAEVLNIKRTELCFVDTLTDKQVNLIKHYAQQREQHIPIDKIFNKAYFYGLEFYVNNDVLSPRADSEVLIDTAIKYIKSRNLKACLDMCTGSGCLAIALAHQTNIDTTAVDISQSALKVAKKNALNNHQSIKFIKSNLFEKVSGAFDIIVSNPPYIPTQEVLTLESEVKDNDPLLALDGGSDGLDFYRAIHKQVNSHLNPNGLLIFEIGETQAQPINKIFNDYKLLEIIKDYNGTERVLVYEKE